MLQNLHVKNLALIDETEVEFGPGLNILTGETGAGKSILLGSVSLALGGRYHASMLRNGAESGLVELSFTVKNQTLADQLKKLDIFPEDGFVTLSRKLMEGRSVSRINGETVSASVLKRAAGLLIDIHGQHDSQSLLERRKHLALLDLCGKDEIRPLKEKMKDAYEYYVQLVQKVEQSSLGEEERKKELALAQFEVKEIEEANLIPGEDTAVEERYRRMMESRRITESVAETYQYTAEDVRSNASDCLSRAIRAFQDAAEFDERGSQLYGQLLEIDSLLNDFNRELSEYAKSFEFSEEEFREQEERLNLLNHLKAKYGKSVDHVLEYLEQKRERIKQLNEYDSFMSTLQEQTAKAERKAEQVALELHQIREKRAVSFAEDIMMQMKELNFLDARLEIRLSDTGRLGPDGRDRAEFFLAVNPGEPLKPLAETASGGELSRVMLAVKTVLADEEDTPTLIFDEIDTGISGVTAGKVGERLRMIGKSRQVICITHLPQIAAVADRHFRIQKEAENGQVKTELTVLGRQDSVKELARMLGGSNITERILESAVEMKELAESER